jgi:predicted anti-sigma-YlaC factor YlaD
MKCSDFLARFSEFYDGDAPESDLVAFLSHLDGCGSCRRYREVVRRGVELLREIPPVEPREDLPDRLRHAVYSLEEERRRRNTSSGGSGIMAMVGVAAVLAVFVGTPLVRRVEPTVELTPIVARRPAALPFVPLATPRPIRTAPQSVLFVESDLWSGSNALLYRHSNLGRRTRDSGLVRIGLQ